MPDLKQHVYRWLVPTLWAMFVATSCILVNRVFIAERQTRSLFHLLQVCHSNVTAIRDEPNRSFVSPMTRRSSADRHRPGKSRTTCMYVRT